MSIQIKPNITPNEVLVRCLLHPLWVSGGKMKYHAFLPPPGGRDVSLLRLTYTNMRFCKNHAKSLIIANSKYWGLGAFLAKCIEDINDDQSVEVDAQLNFTPIDVDNSYMKDISKVTISTPGLPMHADLSYDDPIPEKGTPSTKHREYARKLLKLSTWLQDPNPHSADWDGAEFELTV